MGESLKRARERGADITGRADVLAVLGSCSEAALCAATGKTHEFLELVLGYPADVDGVVMLGRRPGVDEKRRLENLGGEFFVPGC